MVNSLRTNLQELNEKTPAPFTNDVILNYSDYLRSKGITLFPNYQKIIEDVPLEKIIGIDQMYGDMKWGDCLDGRYLKRINRNLQELERNPDYYLSDIEKSGLSLKKIGDEYFINAGKHRVVIARFLEHFNPHAFQNLSPLRNVEIYEYFLDYEFMDIQSSVKEIEKDFPELHFSLTYTDKADEVCLTIVRTGSYNGSERYTRSEVPCCLEKLKNPSIVQKFRTEKTHNLLSFKQCLAVLKKNFVSWYNS